MPGQVLLMIVDDDVDDRFFFKRAVKKINALNECIEAADGVDALEQLEDSTVLPDYIFLDINMPRMDGLRCLLTLKRNERLKDIPVIIYSTSSYKSDMELPISMGAVYYLVKPVDTGELVGQISNAIKYVKEKTACSTQKTLSTNLKSVSNK